MPVPKAWKEDCTRLSLTALAGCQTKGGCSGKVVVVELASDLGLPGSTLVLHPHPGNKHHLCFLIFHLAPAGMAPPHQPYQPDSLD